jgi:predicted  nucleic acid-binding Zn-ribbon protein
VAFLAVLPVLVSAGCDNRALDEAQQEVRDAKVTINKLNYTLKTTQEKIATMEVELSSVKRDRDDLQKQVDRLTHERDQASGFAQQAQEALNRLNTQATGQTTVTVALQKQVTELRTLVDEQEKLIKQLRAEAAAPPAAAPPAETPEKPAAPDPNGF